MNKMIRVQRGRRGLVGLVAATTIVLAGCSGTEDEMQGAYPTVTAASLTTVSADNYDDNEYGLITGSTLTGWIDDWAANKPAHIQGELIILQVSEGALTDAVDASCVDEDVSGVGVCKYFKPAAGVRSYYLDSSTWVEYRDNGVTETTSMVLSGEKMDALLAAYDIDPRNDMIVFAMGTGGGGQNMQMGRAHYLFHYWGTDATHLAMLNGGATHASVIPAGSRGTYLGESNSGAAPTGGTVSVKDLYADNTVLQATLGDMMAVARGEVTNSFVWDARSPGEWGGNLKSTGGTNKDCYVGGEAVLDVDGNPIPVPCYTAMNGAVHGAVNLNYITLLVADDHTEDLDGSTVVDGKDASYRYLDKATLATMVTDLGYKAGDTVYTYCRTTYRAMITGTATGTILGYPTRYYDGAMIEWLQMANYTNKTGGANLPATSPWQTEALTDNLTFNGTEDVDLPIISDAFASSAEKVVETDRAYKTGAAIDVSSSGSSLPANPCGG